MTTVIPRRSMVGDYGSAKRGVPLEVDDDTAKQLVASGLAMLPGGAASAEEKPKGKAKGEDKGESKPKRETKVGRRRAENPTPPLPPGGLTGEEKQSSVSEAGQAPDPLTWIASAPPAQS